MPRFNYGEYSPITVYFAAPGSGTSSSSVLYINPASATTLAANTYFTYLDSPITSGTGTTASTLYIANAPTGGTIANAYALNIAGGKSVLSDITVSSSTTTGALVVGGGVGIGGNLYVGGTIFGTVNGTITSAVVQVTSNGTAGAPAYSWFSDQTTGLYRTGASGIGISLGGTKYIDLATTASTFSNTIVMSSGVRFNNTISPSTTINLTTSNYFVECSGGSATTVAFPTYVGNSGLKFIIMNNSTSAIIVTINPQVGEKLNGITNGTMTLSNRYDRVAFICGSDGWYEI